MPIVGSFRFDDIPVTIGKHAVSWVAGLAYVSSDGTVQEIEFEAFKDGKWETVLHSVPWGKNQLDRFDDRLIVVIAGEIEARCKGQIQDAIAENQPERPSPRASRFGSFIQPESYYKRLTRQGL